MEFRYDHPNVESEWHQKVKTISTIYYRKLNILKRIYFRIPRIYVNENLIKK